jgi:hypothetical protein
VSGEPRYTLEEARWELAKDSCRTQGHDYQIVLAGSGEPTAILCERCGASWLIAPKEEKETQ